MLTDTGNEKVLDVEDRNSECIVLMNVIETWFVRAACEVHFGCEIGVHFNTIILEISSVHIIPLKIENKVGT